MDGSKRVIRGTAKEISCSAACLLFPSTAFRAGRYYTIPAFPDPLRVSRNIGGVHYSPGFLPCLMMLIVEAGRLPAYARKISGCKDRAKPTRRELIPGAVASKRQA